MAKERNCFVVVDNETGGLYAGIHPITEVATMTLDGSSLKELSRYKSYVKNYAGGIYDQAAIDSTGIQPSFVEENGQAIEKVVKELIAVFQAAKRGKGNQANPILVGQNVGFDVSMLVFAFQHCKKDLFDYVQQTYLDTLQMARLKWFRTDVTSFKLKFLCEMAGIEIIDAHGAMNDVVATAELLRYFGANLQNEVVMTDEQKQVIKTRYNKFEM